QRASRKRYSRAPLDGPEKFPRSKRCWQSAAQRVFFRIAPLWFVVGKDEKSRVISPPLGFAAVRFSRACSIRFRQRFSVRSLHLETGPKGLSFHSLLTAQIRSRVKSYCEPLFSYVLAIEPRSIRNKNGRMPSLPAARDSGLPSEIRPVAR